MSNGLTPSQSPITEATSWSDVLQGLNIPKFIAGPAGEALSRLVGHALDIPAAKLDQIKQGIKDKTEAKTIVSQALAHKAADILPSDPALMERAAQSFLAKELRKQTNKEAIAGRAVQLIAETSDQSESLESATSPDSDWMNVFERFAEDASSDRLRDLWARTLVGEIRKPKSFSLQTLRFIAELDHNLAETFDRVADYFIGSSWMPKYDEFTNGSNFTDMVTLEEAGLLSGATGMISREYDTQTGNPIGFSVGTASHVIMYPVANKKIRFEEVIILSRVGREIATLTARPASVDIVQKFANHLPKTHLTKIEMISGPKTCQERQVIWMKEERLKEDQ